MYRSSRTVRAGLVALAIVGLGLAGPFARAPRAASADGTEHDFDFLLGRWDFVVESNLPNSPATYTGHWTAERVGDGALVEDDFIARDDNGVRHYLGVTIRAFDAKTKRWTTTFVAPPAASWSLGAAWRDGNDIAEGPLDPAKGSRARFSGIAPDRFTWTLERSNDGGKTWATMVRVHARRAAS